MFLGPYEILDTIGRGGMAVVLRARAADGREVALKVIQKSGSREMIARFDRERRLLETLGEAEGFVPLLGSGDSPQGPYLVMPYLPGGTLRSRLDTGPLDVDDAIELARELASALARAHAHGIVHRDLKPENILFTRSGRPLIADLGLAKHFEGSDHGSSTAKSLTLSKGGELRGTAGYMPVEQMKDAKSVGPQADVFALGAILYECLAGEPAFRADDFYALMGKVELGAVVPLREQRPETPVWLERVVARALAPRAAQRYSDGASLERALAAEGADVARRRNLLVASAVTLVALAVAGAAVFLLVRGPQGVAPLTSPPAGPPALPAERGGSGGGPADARAHILRSRERTALHDGDGALEEAERAIVLSPGDADAWVARGEARCVRREEDAAIADFTKALAIDPRRALALALRSLARGRKKDVDAARADADRAVELDPRLARSWTALGSAKVNAGDRRGGVADLDRALELDPRDAVAAARRGTARAMLADVAGALEDMLRATSLDPREVGYWYDLAVVRRLRREWDEAIEAATRALELDPRHSNGWGLRAYCRLQKNDRDGGIHDYSRAIELDPNESQHFANRGAARALKGELAGAEADFTKAIELDPAHEDTIQNRGMVRGQRGDAAGAIKDFETYLRMKPDADDAAKMRSMIATLRKKLREKGP